MIASTKTENPFPLEAVATYGNVLTTCADLDYMQACKKQLDDYLIAYQKSDSRYGGCIGLKGGHGSGKTHLLSWLAEQAAVLTVSKPMVVYAKADRASFFDLYTQITGQMKRPDLQLTLAEAVKNLAVEEVNKAEVTKSIEKRLQTPAELQRLFREENLDREGLFLTLRDRLQVSGAPQEITEALLLVESPTLEEKAYMWLSGKRIEDPGALGISYQLEALPIAGETTSIPDVVAVNALETVAALFAVARRPFVLLIDQLEVLFRTDADRRQTLASVIKKLIEQLGRQNVLLFIAGTPEPWELLPRDVAPRLRSREPLSVGTLTSDEALILLQPYCSHQYSLQTLAALMRVTGGNPREILRISHHIFNKNAGNLERASTDDIIECARLAGTLQDRQKLALAEADRILASAGTVLADVDLGGELPVDRLVQLSAAPPVAVFSLTAGDRVSEAKLARSLLSTTRKLNENWPDAHVVVLSVGYSTETIREQLGRAATVIEYEEGSFSRSLQGILAEVIKQGAQTATSSDSVSAVAFERLVNSIDQRLTKIEAQRTEETKKILESFVANTRINTQPERERRELRSRWDVLDALDSLADRNPQDSQTERESMRAVLVANEANIKNSRLEFLGSIYLDCLTPTYYYATERLRSDVLLEMRRVLRRTASSAMIIEHPWRATGIAVAVVVAILLLFIQLAPIMFSYPYNARLAIRMAVLVAGSVALYVPAIIIYSSFTWRSRWNRKFTIATMESRNARGLN